MRSVLRFTALLSLVLLSVPLIAQRNVDEHMTDAAAPLYQRSAFAHGYLHGYEEGFHVADLDIQMGHLLPGVHARHDDRGQPAHYRPEYGDKTLFVIGYKLGMRAGYADSLAGVPFRAISEMRNAADGLAPQRTSMHFDRGFYEGFLNGERQGSGDAHMTADFAGATNSCLAQHPGKQEDSGQYCDGYSRGFQLGYSDGSAARNSSQKSVETAQNSSGKGH